MAAYFLMKVEKLCYFHCFPKHLPENQKRGPRSHMLRVRIFQVEVVMAHVLETGVLCPVRRHGPGACRAGLLAVGSCGHADYWAQEMSDRRAGL